MKLLLILLIATSFIYADTEPYYVTTPYFITVGGVADHGFDDELESNAFPEWTFSGSGTFIREEYREYDGASYAIINATASGDNYFYQDLSVSDIESGQNYILSFRYKILDDDLTLATGGDGPLVKVQVDESSNWIDVAIAKGEPDETGDNWMTARVGFTAPSSNLRLCVGMWDAYGTLAIDDVRINVMDEDDYAKLNNPDFERWGTTAAVPYDWTAVTAGGTVTTTDAETFSGKYAMELERTTSGTTKCYQELDLNPKTHYEGHIYVKTDDVGLNGARFEITDVVGFATVILFSSDSFAGDSGWLSIPFDFTTGATADDVKFEAILGDTGTAYFDGITFRRDPIMIGDFEDGDWDDYWVTESGSNSIPDIVSDGSNSVLEIYNSSEDDTAVYQDIDVIAGIPMLFSGEISTDIVSVGASGGGAFVQLIDNDTDDVIDEDGPFETGDEWESFSLFAPSGISEDYRIRFALDNTSGTMQMDNVGVIAGKKDDKVNVLPQPNMVSPNSGNGVIGGSEKWWIFYQESPDGISLGTGPTEMIADDLKTDLTISTGTASNPTMFYHYFGINDTPSNSKLEVADLSNYGSTLGDFGALIIAPPSNAGIVGEILDSRGISMVTMDGLGDEGHCLISTHYDGREIVLITSIGLAGRYYGVQTFLQLLEDNSSRDAAGYRIHHYDITDSPEMPIRAAHISYPQFYLDPPDENGYPSGQKFKKKQYDVRLLKQRNLNPFDECSDTRTPLEAYVRFLSRMKINMLVVNSPIFWCLDYSEDYIDTDWNDSGDSTNLEVMERLFEYCRKYYVEPVPLMQSFGHAKGILQFKPEEAETCHVGIDTWPPPSIPLPQRLEEFTGGYDTRYVLKKPFVIDSGGRKIQVNYLDGATWKVLTRGIDYDLVGNEIDFDLVNGYTVEDVFEEGPDTDRNYGIHIIKPGLPTYGVEFRVSYDFVNEPSLGSYKSGRHAYCPNSNVLHGDGSPPGFLENQIDYVVEHLEPRFIHFGHDEPWQMHTCRICKNQGDVVHGEYTITPNSFLFARDVNRLREYYLNACEAHDIEGFVYPGNNDGYFRIMIYADHVSKAHEAAKGYPMAWTNYGGGGGAVHQSRHKIHPSVIMNEWYYKVNGEPNLKLWKNSQYIANLIPFGFDVIGGSAGYPTYLEGDYRTGWSGTYDVELFDNVIVPPYYRNFRSLVEFEGTYNSSLPLCKKCKIDDRGYAWFYRRYFDGIPGFIYHQGLLTALNVSSAEFRCNMKGRLTSGSIWFDDVSMMSGKKTGNDFGNWSSNLLENPGFETLGPGDEVFANWHSYNGGEIDPSIYSIDADTNIFFADPGETTGKSCRITSEVRAGDGELNLTLFQNEPFVPPLKRHYPDDTEGALMIGGYIRTRELDNYRLFCPFQWAICGAMANVDWTPGHGKYLGGINLDFTYNGAAMPYDENSHVEWKIRVGDAAVAEWNWSKSYPSRPYLKDLNWDPFNMMEKEVTW